MALSSGRHQPIQIELSTRRTIQKRLPIGHESDEPEPFRGEDLSYLASDSLVTFPTTEIPRAIRDDAGVVWVSRVNNADADMFTQGAVELFEPVGGEL